MCSGLISICSSNLLSFRLHPSFCARHLTYMSCISGFLLSDLQPILADREPRQVTGLRKQSETGIFLPLASF